MFNNIITLTTSQRPLKMASKTREKLIESAKQLFIRKGVENTTIGDIANASDKGRRTIYTYFKDKKEIYRAVIERESDKMVSEITSATCRCNSASEKLAAFIDIRFSQAKNTSSPYFTIKSLLSMDFGRTEKVRRLASEKEARLLDEIISQGIASGEFDRDKAQLMLKVLQQTIKVIDQMYSKDEESTPPADFTSNVSAFLLQAIKP